MPQIELKNDLKLSRICSETDPDKLAQNIAKGYLKGRAITMLFDMQPSPESPLSIEKINGQINQISANNKTYKHVVKLSATPFWIRAIFHKIGMWTNLNDYKEKHSTKAELIAKAFINGTQAPDATANLDYFQNNSFIFSKKAFSHKTQPKSFEGPLITEKELRNFLSKHQDILNNGGSGTHGEPIPNIIMAFTNGTIHTTAHGIEPLIRDHTLNKELMQKTREVFSLIAKKDVSEIEQTRLLKRLADPFKSCAIGRIQIIQQLHSELLCVNLGFEGELENRLHALKYTLLEQLLLEKYPNQQSFTPIHLQLPHLTTGYLAVVGNALGIEGTQAAATDRHKYRVSPHESQTFITNYKKRFQESLDEFCMSIVSDINGGKEGFDATNYGKWLMARVNNKELPSSFGLYDDSKKNYYTQLNAPSESQEDCFTPYISPTEVKQILETLDFIEVS